MIVTNNRYKWYVEQEVVKQVDIKEDTLMKH